MKSLWYRLPLPLKFAFPAALLCLLSSLLVIALAQWGQQQTVRARTDGLGNALASRLAASAARPLLDNDAVHIQAVVAEFAGEPAVQRAALYDLQQHLLGAAGEDKPESAEYSATVHWQDGAIGRAVIQLGKTGAGGWPQAIGFQEMVMLATLLAAVAGALAGWFGLHFDRLLIQLTRRISGEALTPDYPDHDTLGHLLHHPVPPLLEASPPLPVHRGATLLHVYCPSEALVDCERARQQLESVSKLYRGEVSVTRAAGLTARFAADDEMEAPFRALCCAQLLRKLSEPHALRIALAPLASTDDGNPWQEQQLIRQLNQACVDVADDHDISIDVQLQRHPAIAERCELEAREEFWIVKAMKAPYDTLLERQFATLKEQLEAAVIL